MKFLTKALIASIIAFLAIPITSVFAQNDSNFGVALEIASDTKNLNSSGGQIDVLGQFEDKFTGQGTGGAESIRDFMAWIGLEVALPVLVFAGVILALVGFFKLMASESEDETQKATQYILWGVVGIMIMLSAAYLTDQLVGVDDPGEGGVIGMIIGQQSGGSIAAHVYDKMFFPFLRMFIFIIIGVLFIFAAINAFKFIFSADESTKGKSLTSLVYAAVGIIIILLAKSLVEAIYGSYSSITDGENNLGEVGEGFFNNPDFSVLHDVINWTLGLATFILAITIIYQGYLLLVMPSDENTVEKLKKDFGYMFIGILIIGLAYLLVNVFIIQKA